MYKAQQCDSNPVLLSGSGGTVYFADSSFVSPGWSTNYSASYLWDFRDGFTSTQKIHVIPLVIFQILLQVTLS